VEILIQTKPTLLIPIDPTRELTEEIVPTFDIANQIPPPPGQEGISTKAGIQSYLDMDGLLLEIPKVLKSGPLSLDDIIHGLNAGGGDNQEPEILEALEELVQEEVVTAKKGRWRLLKDPRDISIHLYELEMEMVAKMGISVFPTFSEWLAQKDSK
jgi:hypothetical protein